MSEAITKTIEDLHAVKLKLLEIDEDELNDDEKNNLADSLDEVSTDITNLENADLANLSAEFKAEEGDMKSSANSLKADLQQLSNAVAIIDLVASSIGTVTRIVGLL